MNSEGRKELAIKVAKMYYINGESQEKIAELTGMSRSNISRILKKCLDEGIVEITVHDTISVRMKLAHSIQTAFGLKEVIIVHSAPAPDRIYRNVGQSLSVYLMKILKDGMTLGVGRGRACYYIGRNINNKQHILVDVVQLQGSTSSTASLDEGAGMIYYLTSKLNGKGYVLNAPLMVKSKHTQQELMNSDLIAGILKKYRELDVAVFEIEKPNLYVNNRSAQDLLSKADILQLSEIGVSACVCGHYFTEKGKTCNVGIHDRVLAIPPELLKKVPYSIGISIGKFALSATLSILKAGLINVLIIDENLATQIDVHLQSAGNGD